MQNEITFNKPNRLGFLSGSTIKIIACLSMLIDHIGYLFFPFENIFRIIGRLAFPLFTYFIQEGSYYTKKPLKRILLLFGLSILFLIVYYIVDGYIYINVFVSFSISALCIYILDKGKAWAFKSKDYGFKLSLTLFSVALLLTPVYYLYSYFTADYDFAGVLLPILVSLVYFKKYNAPKYLCVLDDYHIRMILFGIGLLLLLNSVSLSAQPYQVLSIIPLIFYNGKPGIKKIKYGFYLFYPLHLVILYAIYYLMYLM